MLKNYGLIFRVVNVVIIVSRDLLYYGYCLLATPHGFTYVNFAERLSNCLNQAFGSQVVGPSLRGLRVKKVARTLKLQRLAIGLHR